MDNARKITDKELNKMERHIETIYRDAYADISRSWDEYMKSHAPKLEKAQLALEEAKKSGNKDDIAKAKEHYERTAKNITVNNKRYKDMIDEVSAKITNINKVALSYINDEMPKIYTVNYNAFENERIAGYSFALVNEQAVKNLATTDSTLLPKKKVDVPKDIAWNEKLINSQMMQGILQGESIPKMAKRLMNVTNMNEASALRNARTMTTSAENKGRQDSFKKANNDGVEMEREWLSAHDAHVRAWHRDLSGVRVGVDEPWENDYGEIMYPGDPGADAANVYNCRCGMRAHVKGFAWNKKKEEPDDVDSKELTFEEKLNSIQTVNFNLKPSDNSDIIKVPIDLEENPAAFDKVGLDNENYFHFLKQVNELPFEEREIPLSDVIATQSIVNKGGVLSSLGSTEPIDVILIDGKYYIYNGHHRAAAAMINGNNKIFAKVRIVKVKKK